MEREELERYLYYLDKPKVTKKGTTHVQVSTQNADLIREFIKNVQSLPKPPTLRRLDLLAKRLKTLSSLVGNKRLDELTEEDIKELNPKLRLKCPKSDSDYRKTLKQFWRLKDKRKFLDLLDSQYMKNPSDDRKRVDPETFWSQREIEAYIEESKRHSPYQLAWAAIWLSSGCRPGEILALRKKHIEFKEPHLIIRVPEGKTGKRIVVLKDKEARAIWSYVLPHLDALRDGDLLFSEGYNAQIKVHKKICKLIHLGSDKDKRFYMSRKMNLTRFYSELGLAKGAMMAGHTVGSRSMKCYVGLTENQLLDEKLNSIQKKICPNPLCTFENQAHLASCEKCSAPLDVRKYADLVKLEKQELSNKMEELVETKFGLLMAKMELMIRDTRSG